MLDWHWLKCIGFLFILNLDFASGKQAGPNCKLDDISRKKSMSTYFWRIEYIFQDLLCMNMCSKLRQLLNKCDIFCTNWKIKAFCSSEKMRISCHSLCDHKEQDRPWGHAAQTSQASESLSFTVEDSILSGFDCSLGALDPWISSLSKFPDWRFLGSVPVGSAEECAVNRKMEQ